MSKRLLVTGLVIGIGALSVGYLFSSVWYSPAIRARIVDAATEKPIGSAVVVATWTVSGGWEGNPIRELAVAEAVTDSEGWFEIDAWGPRFSFGRGSLHRDQPRVRVWADGYVPLILDNTSPSRPPRFPIPTITRSRLDGDVVQLSAAHATDEVYLDALRLLVISMEFAYQSRECEWRQVPQMLARLHLAKQRGEDIGHGGFLYLVEHIGGPARCGDPETDLGGYIQ